MHARRLACLLLGFGLAAGVSMAWLAVDRPASVERVLRRPNPAARRAPGSCSNTRRQSRFGQA